MQPDDRRKAIVTVLVPLILERGGEVSTREIAQAAGIAEGTIFRVFPDKDSLIRDAIGSAFDPVDVLEKLDTIDPALPLDERVLAIVTELAARLDRIFHLMMVLRTFPPEEVKRAAPQPVDDPIFEKVAELLAPDADAFRSDLKTAVKRLRLVTFAGTHPRIADDDPLAPADIVDLFLHGSLASSTALDGMTVVPAAQDSPLVVVRARPEQDHPEPVPDTTAGDAEPEYAAAPHHLGGTTC
jgi:AcrR family transcriptional regulator